MRIFDCEQGSAEWFEIRKGRPTSSEFHRIITKTSLKLSASRFEYAGELACQIKDIWNPQFEGNAATDRGHDFESAAIEAYENESCFKTSKVGFVYPEDSTLWGCSPDRLVGDVGLVEVKCPYPKTFCKYARDNGEFVKDHRLQVQSQLWITGRDWCDLFAFAPEVKNTVRVRVLPDQKCFDAFDEYLPAFVAEVHELANSLTKNPDFVNPEMFRNEKVEW